MSSRPRILVFDPSDQATAALQSLSDQVDVVRAQTAEQGLELLQQGGFEGICTGEPDPLDGATPPTSGLRILSDLSAGVAIVDARLNLVWFNQAFINFSPRGPRVGENIYDALDSPNNEGPDFCPFLDCLGGRTTARSRLHLPSGCELEAVVQPLPGADASSSHALCLLRDVTFEVRDREKLFALQQAGMELSNLDPEELSRMSIQERIDLLKANILQYSRRILNFSNLEIRLLDPRTRHLEILLSEGMGAREEDEPLLAEPQGNGVTGFVAATGTSYLCEDVLNDPLYIPGAVDARSSLTVPIVSYDRPIGTFNVESPEPRHFSDSDREFLELFTREIAVALHVLDLLREEKRVAGSASIEAIAGEIGVPTDEILTDAIALLEAIDDGDDTSNLDREVAKRLIENARTIKSSIQRAYKTLEATYAGNEPNEQLPLAGRRVLLVDSDQSIRRSAHGLLSRVGCEVVTAKEGREALALLKIGRYDVVIGDIRLPDMNGYEFFGQVRSVFSETPIILMTGFGYDSTHSLVKARQEGLRVVLYKPFRFDRLREAIEDALDPSRQTARPRTAQRIRI
ncbi:Transcriptional regulatory protein QseF [Planctomycetes bacterium Pan216]|uniref:Transcriptional regulatory protein QseF n=1 Tax=Kolteria novifilia TaxID=2527975 RepID=A0A518BBS8_9BACT|nr:Transcriptional regulatory protein QseF [Planctomycetes bacterium Pan216]